MDSMTAASIPAVPAAPVSQTRLVLTTAMIQKHEKWMRSMARRYASDAVLVDDLVQEGFIALAEASKSWSEDGGASLLTYASTPVRKAMYRHANRERAFGLKRSGRAKAGSLYAQSIDSPVGPGDDRTQHDMLPAQQATPEEQLVTAQRAAAVRAVLATVPTRDREILQAVLAGDTVRVVGPRFGVTKSRVDQIVQKWLPVLRKRLEEELGRDGC